MRLFNKKLSAGSSLNTMAAMATPRSVLSISALVLGAFVAVPLMFSGTQAVANDAKACYGTSIVMASAKTEAPTTLLRTSQFEYGQAYGATFVTASVMTLDADGNLVQASAEDSAAILQLVNAVMGINPLSNYNVMEANAGATTWDGIDPAAILGLMANLRGYDAEIGGQKLGAMTVAELDGAFTGGQIWTAKMGGQYTGGALDEAGLMAMLKHAGYSLDAEDGATFRITQ